MIARRCLVALTLLGILSGQAWASAQIPEEILLDGKSEDLFSEPLNQYLLQDNHLALLEPLLSKQKCSGSWRDYRGVWEVRDARLYLSHLETDPCSSKPKAIPLSSVFLLANGPVFAEWYTGTLIVPKGKLVKRVHMGYQSEYDWYVVFTVIKGKVVDRRETSTLQK